MKIITISKNDDDWPFDLKRPRLKSLGKHSYGSLFHNVAVFGIKTEWNLVSTFGTEEIMANQVFLSPSRCGFHPWIR